jgi:hypothetical protein
VDPDPDQAFHLNADPDQAFSNADPDPAFSYVNPDTSCKNNADPDPQTWLVLCFADP